MLRRLMIRSIAYTGAMLVIGSSSPVVADTKNPNPPAAPADGFYYDSYTRNRF
jgi:hypothetical protein